MQIIYPRKALNKAYLKQKINRDALELFRSNMIKMLENSKAKESEEYHKNLLNTFLSDTYYKETNFINTLERTDLVIHDEATANSNAAVLIETKKPGNKPEMPSKHNINTKALRELLRYYLRERVDNKNKFIRHLIITDLNDFFIFNENDFDRYFYHSKKLHKDYERYRNSGKDTGFFYREIAAPLISEVQDKLTVTHFRVSDFKRYLYKSDADSEKKLIPFYKILSPPHLLKKPFANDSNTLDRNFYNELLHIIGLQEVKQKNKKLIQRLPQDKKQSGSLIENTINILDSEDIVAYYEKRGQYGDNKEEQLFNIALELAITWVNRVLFMKLLEAQLVSYHRKNESFKFLNIKDIPDYDALNKLFFQVLAVKPEDRNENVKDQFKRIPYLNSSLFEPNELERHTIRINNLENEFELEYVDRTVLTDEKGRRRKGQENALKYFFDFLDAYDFSSEGSEDIQEENKNLINASVLGLIFEKINGYKDGSFFTPGFITEYMARETIRRAVVQKFNSEKGWGVNDFDELKENIGNSREDREEVNRIINSIKICDPAVGSGHFLVSALNEMIALKSELRVLSYRDGSRIKYYHAKVENDELIIEDAEEGSIFEYHLSRNEIPITKKQKLQEALFHEKQTIIENCLFGVDINSNSVKICRLRLWIELLKNAYYYQPDGQSGEDFSSPPNPLSETERGAVGAEDNPCISKHPSNNFKDELPRTVEMELPRELLEHAREMRKEATKAEDILWQVVRNRRLGGFKFRRQHPIAEGFILDFYCAEVRLAVELDGGYHLQETQREHDEGRTHELEKYGIKVIRFWNSDVEKNIAQVLKTILAEAKARKAYSAPNPLSVSERGPGGEEEIPAAGNIPHDTSKTPDNEKQKQSGQTHSPAKELQLQTLPNIDINIKTGNSLVSRFPLNASLKKALHKSKWNIDSYRLAVDTYRNAQSKEEKQQMRRLINDIKSDFETNIDTPFKKKMAQARGKMDNIVNEIHTKKLWGDKISPKMKKDLDKASKRLAKLEEEKENRENNVIYRNAFEWRFEFPEVLDDNGDYKGFDVVIGNPPYIDIKGLNDTFVRYLFDNFSTTSNRINVYSLFIELGHNLLRDHMQFGFIVPNSMLMNSSYKRLRELIIEEVNQIVKLPDNVFKDAIVETILLFFSKQKNQSMLAGLYKHDCVLEIIDKSELYPVSKSMMLKDKDSKLNIYLSTDKKGIIEKAYKDAYLLKDIADFSLGITPYDKYKGHDEETIKSREFHSKEKIDDYYKPLIKGENVQPYIVTNEIKEYIKYGDWLGAPREEKFFTYPRVIVRQIISGNPPRIYAGYSDEQLYFTQIGFGIIPKEKITSKFLVALMNSKLINFIHKYLFLDPEKVLFQKILIENCKRFPIIIPPKEKQDEISKLVEEIFLMKENNINADIAKVEIEIGKSIYE